MKKFEPDVGGDLRVDCESKLAALVSNTSAIEKMSAERSKEFADVFYEVLLLPQKLMSTSEQHLAKAFDFLIRDDEHLALVRLLLSRHSMAGPRSEVLASFARSYGQRLVDGLSSDATAGAGMWIAALLLRKHLPTSVVTAKLAEYHRRAIEDYDAEQALLLYNTMFNRDSFKENVAELAAALPSLDWVEQWKRHGLKKLRIFLYYWPDYASTSTLVRLLDHLSIGEETRQNDIDYLDFKSTLKSIVAGKPVASSRIPGAALHGNGRRIAGVIEQYGLRRIGLGGRRPRVAICVSGQLRGYGAALASWRKHLLPGVDADFYVHAWKQIGRAGSEPHRRFLPFAGDEFTKAYREQCMRMEYPEFVRHYPSLFTSLATSGNATEAQLQHAYSTDKVVLEDDTAGEFAGWSNARKMHYKIDRVQGLVDASKKDYDLVLRIRPDKAMRLMAGSWSDMRRVLGDGKSLLADLAMGVHYGNLMIGDQVACGTPSAMRIYSSAFTDLVELEEKGVESSASLFRGHVSLARQCFINDIAVGKFAALYGGLLGATPLSSREIEKELQQDSAGRSNAVDQLLLSAVRRDISNVR